MDKITAIKGVFTIALGGLLSYFSELVVPISLLIAVMIIDYLTGMAKSYIAKELSSKRGMIGIIKKAGYLLLVLAVGGGCDWLIQQGTLQIGVTLPFTGPIALIICIWLIINELISILENLQTIGVPVPGFVGKLLKHLKQTTENKGEIKETEAINGNKQKSHTDKL